MLDIGGWEFLVVAFVLIMVVGPKELPKMLRSFTAIMRKVRAMASEFTHGMQAMADEAEIGDIKTTLTNVKQGNLANIADSIDPAGGLKSSVEEIKASTGGIGPDDSIGQDVATIRDLAGKTGNDIAASVKVNPEAGPAEKSSPAVKKSLKPAAKKS